MKHAMKNILTCLKVLSLLVVAQPLAAFAPSTTARSSDQAWRMPMTDDKQYHARVFAEFSTEGRGYDINSHSVDPLQIYNSSESTIEMLRNPLPAIKPACDDMLRKMGNPSDDGVRGHFQLSGSYSEMSIMPMLGAWIEFKSIPGKFGIDVHVPVMQREMTLNSMVDLTNVTDNAQKQDLDVAAQMPGMTSFMQTTGNLYTDKISTTGLGDTVIMGVWRNWFRQDKELIRGVELFAQLGISLPTGVHRDEDQAFSMALGSNGAFGVPVGLGLNVDFINTIRAGLNVDFMPYLDQTLSRRLKTIQQQTELFLLNKGDASMDYGLNWQFYLYLQSHHFLGGLSAKAAYQYLRHDADKLTPNDNGFSYDVVNSSSRLSEWYVHNLIFSLDYDHIDSEDDLVVPQLSVFYKFPVGGKAVIGIQSVGLALGVAF